MNEVQDESKTEESQSRLTVEFGAKKSKLKLFVWQDFCPDYTSGLAFAIAKDETEARKLVVKERQFEPYDWGSLTIHPIKRIAKCVNGGG